MVGPGAGGPAPRQEEALMYAKPMVPVAGGAALAATGVYTGTAVIVAVVAVVVGLVLIRVASFRRGRPDGK